MKHGRSGFFGGHGASGFVAQLVAAGSTLLNGLVSYWTLDETSGVRYDSVGENDLTDNNTVGVSLRGPEGAVASFVKANAETLSHPDFCDQIDMSQGLTVVWWENMTVAQVAQEPVKLGNNIYQGAAAFICNDAGAVSNYRFVSAEAGDYAPISTAAIFPTADLVWHFLAARYLPDTKKVSASYDATGQVVSATALSNHPVYQNNKPIVWGGSCDGRFGLCAVWNRVLTDEEEQTLFASGNGLRYSELSDALKTGLVSWWELDEASGVRYDSQGSNDLTDNNTVESATAVAGAMDGGAASFVAANGESLSVTPSPFAGLTDLSFFGWVKFTDITGSVWFVEQDEGGTQRCFSWNRTGGTLNLYVFDTVSGLQVAYGPTLEAGVWYHLGFTYDSATKVATSYVNNAAYPAAALTNGLNVAASTPFVFNSDNYPANVVWDEPAIWSRVLTDDERAELYAAGAGKFYPFEG